MRKGRIAAVQSVTPSSSVSRKTMSIIDKLASYLRLVAWTLRVAQKPNPREFKITAKMILGLTFTIGLYAFLISLIRLFVFAGRPGSMPLARIPPPASYILAGIIAAIMIGIGVYLYISFRKTVKEESRRKV